jgi:hypothetical protein
VTILTTRLDPQDPHRSPIAALPQSSHQGQRKKEKNLKTSTIANGKMLSSQALALSPDIRIECNAKNDSFDSKSTETSEILLASNDSAWQ